MIAIQYLEAVAEELRELIASQDVRLNALEVAVMSGITDSSGKARVTLQPADLSLAKPVETESDSPSHPAESLSLPPQSQDDFEQLVKDTYKECGEKLRENYGGIAGERTQDWARAAL